MNEVQVNSQGNVQSVDFTSQEPIQPQRSSQTEMMVTRQAQEVQVAMLAAKKFPRDQVVAYNNIMRACQRRKLAESSMYEFPRGNEKITGPSIRLAEAIAHGTLKPIPDRQNYLAFLILDTPEKAIIRLQTQEIFTKQ